MSEIQSSPSKKTGVLVGIQLIGAITAMAVVFYPAFGKVWGAFETPAFAISKY